MQDLRREAFFLAQQPQQQMLSSNVLVREPLSFFSGIRQHALAFVRERQVNRGGNFFADGGVAFDLLADGFHRGMRAQEAVGQRLVFAQQSQQQVLGLNVRRAKLACLVPSKKYYPSRLLCIALEHCALREALQRRELLASAPSPFLLGTPHRYRWFCSRSHPQAIRCTAEAASVSLSEKASGQSLDSSSTSRNQIHICQVQADMGHPCKTIS